MREPTLSKVKETGVGSVVVTQLVTASDYLPGFVYLFLRNANDHTDSMCVFATEVTDPLADRNCQEIYDNLVKALRETHETRKSVIVSTVVGNKINVVLNGQVVRSMPFNDEKADWIRDNTNKFIRELAGYAYSVANSPSLSTWKP